MRLRYLTTARRDDDRGSLVVALLVVMVLMMLSATVMTRTLSSMTSTMQDTNYQAAKAQADAALSDALFRIDQFGENDTSSFCVAPSNSYCSVSSLPAAPLAQYTARRVDPNTFLVRAQAKVNKSQPFTLQATVSRSLLFPFAIFAEQGATFKGNTSNSVTTTDPNFPANIGSAGTIDCSAQGVIGNAQFANSVVKCSNPQPFTMSYNPQDPSAAANCPTLNDANPPPSPPIPCVPSGANTNCPSSWGSGTYSGTYYCTSSIALTGTINVGTGGLFIYFVPNNGATLGISSSAVINPTSDAVGGDPSQFAIYAGGSNGLVFDGSAPTINGTLWAPHTDVTANGCKINVQGAIVLQSITCHGGPNLTVTYDSRLQTEVQRGWTATNYQVMGAADFTLPSSSCSACY